jgi:hypothetical protein
MDLKELNKKLISESAKSACSYKVIYHNLDIDPEINFEILINIYMNLIMSIDKLLNNEIKEINKYEINKYHLEIPEKWINSLGYSLIVSEIYAESYKDNIENYYCQIYLNEDEYDNVSLFYDNYIFILNKYYKNKMNIQDIVALFIKKNYNDKDIYYSIKFKAF